MRTDTSRVLVCLAAVAGLAAAASAKSGLVGWWRGEGNSLNSVDGVTAGTRGNVRYDHGRSGDAFLFDGNAQSGLTTRDLDQYHITGSLSIEADIKVLAYPREYPVGDILFRGDSREDKDPYGLAVGDGGTIRFQVEDDNDKPEIHAKIPLHRWVHVLAVLDVDAGEMRLYEDNELVASRKTTIRPLADLDEHYGPGIGIGNHPNFPKAPSPQPFHGLIDEVKLYNVALPAPDTGPSKRG